MKMLIDFGLIPEEYNFQIKVFNFNKYLKKLKEDAVYYGLDSIAFNFFSNNFSIDVLIASTASESGFKIKQNIWDNIYKKQMDIIRPYIKDHNQELLNAINNHLTADVWNKYCLGNISRWEMSSISCYIHEHELAKVNHKLYGWSDFTKLPEQPEIDRIINIKGKIIPIFKLRRIAGVVLDRDKTKKTVNTINYYWCSNC